MGMVNAIAVKALGFFVAGIVFLLVCGLVGTLYVAARQSIRENPFWPVYLKGAIWFGWLCASGLFISVPLFFWSCK